MLTISKIIKYIFLVGITFLFSTYLYFDNSSTFPHILTFLSITTGFSITGLSIIATSKFSKDLYKKEVTNDNSKTLLHQLVGKFEKAIVTFTTTIVLILVFSFIASIEFKELYFCNTKISIQSVLSRIVWMRAFLSHWNFTEQSKLFSKWVIQSA